MADMMGTLNLGALREHTPTLLDVDTLEKCAVIVPVLTGKHGDTVLLTRRSDSLAFQPGHVSFPGGKAESSDVTYTDAALRELEEEVGLMRNQVDIVGQLDAIMVGGRFSVTPLVGIVDPSAVLAPAGGEVQELVRLQAEKLADPDCLCLVEYERAGAIRKAYQFAVDGTLVWGATARILKQFMELAYGARYKVTC